MKAFLRTLVFFCLLLIGMATISSCGDNPATTTALVTMTAAPTNAASVTTTAAHAATTTTASAATTVPVVTTPASATTLDSFEAIEAELHGDVRNTINELYSEREYYKDAIDSYEMYWYNADTVEEFYDKVNTETEKLCERLYAYALRYGKLILSSNKSYDDMYDDFDEIYDNIYDDARDEIYDEIYDGLLDDMYDTFYAGILDDAYGDVPYSEWSDYRSNEYDNWSDTRSDVYDSWSDTGSDIYDFWSDVRSDLWDDDIEDAKNRLIDFEEDVNRLLKIPC